MGFHDRTLQRENHKHSKSYPENKRIEDDQVSRLSFRNGFVKQEKKLSPDVVKVESSVTQEIIELEKSSQSQFDVRKDLERALGCTKSSQDDSIFTPKSATGLIKEVAVLELEVMNLEKYLLSLYRKAFNKQASVYVSPSFKQHRSITPKQHLQVNVTSQENMNRLNMRIGESNLGVSPLTIDSNIHIQQRMTDSSVCYSMPILA